MNEPRAAGELLYLQEGVSQPSPSTLNVFSCLTVFLSRTALPRTALSTELFIKLTLLAQGKRPAWNG